MSCQVSREVAHLSHMSIETPGEPIVTIDLANFEVSPWARCDASTSRNVMQDQAGPRVGSPAPGHPGFSGRTSGASRKGAGHAMTTQRTAPGKPAKHIVRPGLHHQLGDGEREYRPQPLRSDSRQDHGLGTPERLGVARPALHTTQSCQTQEDLVVPPVTVSL